MAKIQSFKKQKPEANELLPWWVPPEKFKILSDLSLNKYSTAVILEFAAEAGLEKTSLKIGLFPIPILYFNFKWWWINKNM